MAKYKVPELAKMIGQVRQYVATNVKRGKLLKDDDGLIDLDHPMNKAWFDSQRSSFIHKVADPAYVSPIKGKKSVKREEHKKPTVKKQVESPVIDQTLPLDFNASPVDTDDIYTQKTKAELKIKLLDIQKREIEIEQKRGKLLNIDTAKGIVSAYLSSYSKGLNRDIETWLHRILDIHKISLTEKSKHASELEVIMNMASDRTMSELMKKLQEENTQL